MKAAIVVMYGAARPGHERESISYARDVDEFWLARAREGACSEPTWLWSSKGQSIWFVQGEAPAIFELTMREDVRKMLMKGNMLIEDFSWETCMVGRDEMLSLFDQVAGELAHA
ncbi:MAG TPA: hypothetical protein VF054_16740 [Micromonosporaceae bacterium]